MELGLIVYSKAGRDQGAYYAVVEVVDENTVRIADGNLRHIKNAKLKNGTQVFDKELFSALRFYNDNNK